MSCTRLKITEFPISCKLHNSIAFAMTLSIDIDNFQNWSAIFRKIQRQENLQFFAAIEPPSFGENEERKKKSCGRLANETSRSIHLKLKRQASDGEVTYGTQGEAKYQPRRKSL